MRSYVCKIIRKIHVILRNCETMYAKYIDRIYCLFNFNKHTQ